MLKGILIGLAVIVVGFVVVVATRPEAFRVSRSGVVAAPPAVAFAQVNDLRAWDAWSPWAKMDPEAKQSFSGPASGAGASFAWAGNHKVGEGKLTILESRPDELIRMNLEFLKPMAGSSITEFTFQPQGEGTLVTWTMQGKNNFIAKAMTLFMDCDKMIGGDFEKGLAGMNAAATAAKP